MPQFVGYLRRSYRRDRQAMRMQILAAASGFDDDLRRRLLGLISA